jgi:hypothetical protein
MVLVTFCLIGFVLVCLFGSSVLGIGHLAAAAKWPLGLWCFVFPEPCDLV